MVKPESTFFLTSFERGLNSSKSGKMKDGSFILSGYRLQVSGFV